MASWRTRLIRSVSAGLAALLLPGSPARAEFRPGPPPMEATASATLEQTLRENAHFFGILVNLAVTAGLSEPLWYIDSKDLNLNLISRSLRDSQGRQIVRVRVAGTVRNNNNVELSLLDRDGTLVGKGFFGFESGQLEFSTPQGTPVIEGFIDGGGYYVLKDLRLATGSGTLSSGYALTCYNCAAMPYAWYDPEGYQVGGGRIVPAWYNNDYTKLRVLWTFEFGSLGISRPSYGDAEYDLGREVTGAINSALFDSNRTAGSFFANPYSLLPEPAGKSYIPRLTDNTGLAVTNPSSGDSRITYTLRRFDGSLVQGAGIINPVTYRFAPGEQVAAFPADIFRGFDLSDRRPVLGTGEVGWVEITSDDGDLQAMFLEGDAAAGALDGSIGAESGGTPLVFPHLELGAVENTEIEILNLSYEDAMLSLELLDRAGQVLRQEGQFYIAGRGMRNFYLGGGSSFLAVSDPSRVATLRVRCASSAGDCARLIGLATFRDLYGSISTSYAAAGPKSGSTLVGAHFVSGQAGRGAWTTTVRVLKLTGGEASVYLDLYASDGTLLSTLREVLAAGAQAKWTMSGGGLPGGDRYATGYLRVRSDAGEIAGDVSISWSDGFGSLSSSYPLSSYLSRLFSFNQMVQGRLGSVEYWTGLAVMNDLDRPVRLEVQIYTPEGRPERTIRLELAPYEQRAALITEFLGDPSYERQGGYLRLSASDPVTAIVLYGDSSSRFLASVPGIPR